MSGPEDSAASFLQRWSRRKRTPPARASDATEPLGPQPPDGEVNPSAAASSEAALPAFDPAALPPIESITAVSDIRAFLAPGVPQELTCAALRRVWVTDPTIRDFVGLAENQWDFTKPDGVPGFGPLELTPELRRMVANLIGGEPKTTASAPVANVQRDQQTAEISAQPGSAASPRLLPGISDNPEPSRDDADRVAAATPRPEGVVEDISQSGNRGAAVQQTPDHYGGSRIAERKHGSAIPK